MYHATIVPLAGTALVLNLGTSEAKVGERRPCFLNEGGTFAHPMFLARPAHTMRYPPCPHHAQLHRVTYHQVESVMHDFVCLTEEVTLAMETMEGDVGDLMVGSDDDEVYQVHEGKMGSDA